MPSTSWEDKRLILDGQTSKFTTTPSWTLKEMEEEARREKQRKLRQQVVNCCKKFAAFLFSHVGLAGMVVAYSIMGGFIFRAIEAPEEVNTRHEISSAKNKTIDDLCAQAMKILNVTASAHVTEEFRVRVREIFTTFQEMVRTAVKDKGWDGNDSSEVRQWTFAGALLYAVTVVTTIGKIFST